MIQIRCYEPVQAHKAMMQQVWPKLKASTTAGHAMVLSLKPETRSLKQNARLWAMLTEISQQVEWYGKYLTPDSWKNIFSASLKKQDLVPGLHGDFVVIGASTSKMTRAEMCDMQTLMEAFGAQHGVQFSDGERIDETTGEIYQ